MPCRKINDAYYSSALTFKVITFSYEQSHLCNDLKRVNSLIGERGWLLFGGVMGK